MIVVRDEPAPPGGRPILSWAHGTTGIADCAAPSRYGVDQALFSDYSPRPYTDGLFRHFLDQGYLVVATDYEGLGTPGVHPYLVGTSEGRSVLDAARAARRLRPVRGSGPVVVAGHSQGGHAALWAGQLAPDYAPELDVRGVVAFAPAANLATIAEESLADLRKSNASPRAGNLALVVSAWQKIYGLDYPSPPLAAKIRATVDSLVDTCELAPPSTRGRWVTEGSIPEAWSDEITKNTPGPKFEVPLLILQGSADEQISCGSTAAAVRSYRDAGTSVTLAVIKGASHRQAVSRADVDHVLDWTHHHRRGSTDTEACG